MSLEGRVAIVTAGGGTQVGIGPSVVHQLARAGASVAVVDLDGDAAKATAEDVGTAGGRAIAIQADVADEDDARRAVDETVAAFGTVSILMNHAGIGVGGPIEQMPYETWRRICAVNLDGTFFFTRAVIPHMKAANWGRIISTASRAAYRSSKTAYERGMAGYAATKAGVIGFSRAAAYELGPHQITVNVIAPGFTNHADRDYDEARLAEEGQVLPLRSVRPEEIAAAVMYLVGPGSDRTTGQVLHVNSGSYFNA